MPSLNRQTLYFPNLLILSSESNSLKIHLEFNSLKEQSLSLFCWGSLKIAKLVLKLVQGETYLKLF